MKSLFDKKKTTQLNITIEHLIIIFQNNIVLVLDKRYTVTP